RVRHTRGDFLARTAARGRRFVSTPPAGRPFERVRTPFCVAAASDPARHPRRICAVAQRKRILDRVGISLEPGADLAERIAARAGGGPYAAVLSGPSGGR